MRLDIKSGKHMKMNVLKEVDKIWQKAFTVTYSSTLENNGELGDFFDDLFFILSERDKILSAGRLRPVRKIRFMNKSYKILGIADIVSVKKRAGYGKKIVTAMGEYLANKKKIGMGFCKVENAEFYRKCGFGVATDLVKNFIFKGDNGRSLKDEFDDDVIFSSLGKKLINKIIKNPKEKVFISQKPW